MNGQLKNLSTHKLIKHLNKNAYRWNTSDQILLGQVCQAVELHQFTTFTLLEACQQEPEEFMNTFGISSHIQKPLIELLNIPYSMSPAPSTVNVSSSSTKRLTKKEIKFIVGFIITGAIAGFVGGLLKDYPDLNTTAAWQFMLMGIGSSIILFSIYKLLNHYGIMPLGIGSTCCVKNNHENDSLLKNLTQVPTKC